MDVGEYLLSLNLPFAMLVGGVVIVVGLVVLRFLMATTSEMGRMVPGAGSAAGHALDGRDIPLESWVCTVCRSVNTPHATQCYRGCGPREQLAEPLPSDRSLLADRQNGKRVL